MLYLIEFHLTPDQADALPVEVDTWLMSVLVAMKHIEGGK